MEQLIFDIKSQIVDINLELKPAYSHHLYKDVNLLVRIIRLKMPHSIYIVKEIIQELHNILFLLRAKMEIYQDYDALENISELITCTIITLNKLLSRLENRGKTNLKTYVPI